MENLRDTFIQAVTDGKDTRLAVHLDKYFRENGNNALLADQIMAMATESKQIFLEVYETFLNGSVPEKKLNLTSLRHCLKRIFKAC